MELKVHIEKDDISVVKMKMDKLGNVVREAMRESAKETADFMEAAVADDIAAGGRFGDRWQEMFHADISETQRTVRITTDMRPDGPPMIYWKVFQYGATINAKNAPYLHFPFKDANPWRWVKVKSVRIPKKFHINEIVNEEAAKAGDAFGRILGEMIADAE